MRNHLPPLRRPRRQLNLAAIASIFSSGVAKVQTTIEPFAEFWDSWNEQQRTKSGPLWVALGDSVTQGIGASDPPKSNLMQPLHTIRERSGEPWRLINLSMSGARFQDVVDRQLCVMYDFNLEPSVVSALIGSNDVIWRRNTSAIITDAKRLVNALPTGTVLSRLSVAKNSERRLAVNKVFDDAANDGDLHLFQAWDWPSGANLWAEDKFHPNDKAHVHLHDNLIQALERISFDKL